MLNHKWCVRHEEIYTPVKVKTSDVNYSYTFRTKKKAGTLSKEMWDMTVSLTTWTNEREWPPINHLVREGHWGFRHISRHLGIINSDISQLYFVRAAARLMRHATYQNRDVNEKMLWLSVIAHGWQKPELRSTIRYLTYVLTFNKCTLYQI